MLFNSTYITFRLGHHEVWTRASTSLQVPKEPPLHNYFKIKNSVSPYFPFWPNLEQSPSYSWVRSWSHHRRNILEPCISSTPVHRSYMGRLSIYSAMVACHLRMYYFIGQITAASKFSITDDHSHTSSLTHQDVILEILWVTSTGVWARGCMVRGAPPSPSALGTWCRRGLAVPPGSGWGGRCCNFSGFYPHPPTRETDNVQKSYHTPTNGQSTDVDWQATRYRWQKRK